MAMALNYKDSQPSDFELPSKAPDAVSRKVFSLRRLYEVTQECGSSWTTAHCDQGHEFAKQILCGREFCATCGERGSDSHQRKAGQVIDKVQQLGERGMGYIVLEPMVEDREKFHSAAELAQAARQVEAVLRDYGKPTCPVCGRPGKQEKQTSDWFCPTSPKRHGRIGPASLGAPMFPRGVLRWHFFGEPPCPKHFCKQKGRWDRTQKTWTCPRHGHFKLHDVPLTKVTYNPHLNLLLDGEFLDKPTLTALQEALSNALLGEFVATRNEDGSVKELKRGMILHYNYVPALDSQPQGAREKRTLTVEGPEGLRRSRIARYLHRAKYVTHPSFLSLAWDPDLAVDLINFRNTRTWGDWHQEPQWTREENPAGDDMAATVAIGKGVCPMDGSPLTWDKKILHGTDLFHEWQDVGGGYRMKSLKIQDTIDMS